MRAINAEAPLETVGASGGRKARWAAYREAVANLIDRIYQAEAARAHLERRYLDGHRTLFPDVAAGWQALREQARRLAGPGDVTRVAAPRATGARHRRVPS